MGARHQDVGVRRKPSDSSTSAVGTETDAHRSLRVDSLGHGVDPELLEPIRRSDNRIDRVTDRIDRTGADAGADVLSTVRPEEPDRRR